MPIENFPVISTSPVVAKVLPSNVRFSSPFKASVEENVAILLFEPLATAEIVQAASVPH